MNRTTRNVLWGVGFVAGLTLLGTGAANADTTGEDGTASGNQVLGVVGIPLNLGGNTISVLGDSSSSGSSSSGTSGSGGGGSSSSTSGSDGTASGNQVNPVVSVPINLGGNAVSVLGDSSSSGSNSSTGGTSTSGSSDSETSGTDGIAGGNQIIPGVSLPIAVGGNAISVLGDSSSTGTTTGTTGGTGTGGGTTNGSGGILGGTQIIPNVDLPITIGGNAISVIGDTTTVGTVTTPTDPTDPTDPTNPVDPTDPTNPVDPVDPTGGTVTLAAADGSLAITGADPWAALITAGLLLLGGLLFLAFGRTRRFTARG